MNLCTYLPPDQTPHLTPPPPKKKKKEKISDLAAMNVAFVQLFLQSNKTNWQGANDTCAQHGAHLATFRTQVGVEAKKKRSEFQKYVSLFLQAEYENLRKFGGKFSLTKDWENEGIFFISSKAFCTRCGSAWLTTITTSAAAWYATPL